MTTMYTSTISSESGKGSITIVETDTGRTHVVTADDPNFNHIWVAMERRLPLDEALMFRIPKNIVTLSSRVSLDEDSNSLLFDGSPVGEAINETARRWVSEGRELTPIVKFMENIQDNVSQNSREELFKWLTAQRLEIDEDGMVIGYRGLRSDMMSAHAGGAFVLTAEQREEGFEEPGQWVEGHVPNKIGSIVSMNREDVDDNTGASCSHGLHIGSESYARSWADSATTIVVRVNPRDVVAVPKYEVDKMRVCRYEILSMIGHDHEPEADPNAAQIPTVEGTEAALDELVPEEFRGKMSRTERFMAKIRRNN